MIKDKVLHNHLKVRSACKRLKIAIDQNPEFFKGLKMPANEARKPRYIPFRSLSVMGILLAFFVKVFH